MPAWPPPSLRIRPSLRIEALESSWSFLFALSKPAFVSQVRRITFIQRPDKGVAHCCNSCHARPMGLCLETAIGALCQLQQLVLDKSKRQSCIGELVHDMLGGQLQPVDGSHEPSCAYPRIGRASANSACCSVGVPHSPRQATVCGPRL